MESRKEALRTEWFDLFLLKSYCMQIEGNFLNFLYSRQA